MECLLLGAGRPKSRRSSGSPFFSLQMLHLAMNVLLLNCALQQILAGDLTRGGLLSFLLYQEDVGKYMHVSQELCVLSFSSFGFYFVPLKKTN